MTSFVTTPIFYANGDPHLGHAYTGIIADIIHRFRQISGEHNMLITGTDEHGLKIASAAANSGSEVSAFVDKKAAAFSGLWPELTIHPDVFIRTTQPAHKAHVIEVWNKLVDNDDIYAGSYSGQYCVSCEQYYAARELDNNLCPVHKQETETVSEATYLFRLEKYRQPLLDYYQSQADLITPDHFQKSIIALLQEGPLEDLSISRVNNAWGVKVPNDPDHTVYVWIDALFSYISAIQQTGHSSADIGQAVHVIGKDILKFHALYWPAFLLALDLPLPEKVVVHGWWTIDGEKISKSNPKTTVSPNSFSQQLSADGLRYALLRQKPLYRDGNAAIDELVGVVNTDLANNLANLVKRNNTLVLKHFGGTLEEGIKHHLDEECEQLLDHCNQLLGSVIQHYKDYGLYQVTLVLKQVLDELNAFFHHREPWRLNKGKESEHVKSTCFVVSNSLCEVALAYLPLIPELAGNILAELGVNLSSGLLSGAIELNKVQITGAESHFGRIQ